MFAVVAYFKDGSIDLIGFANSIDGANAMVESYVDRKGADYLGDKGVRFCVELAA